MASDRDGSTFGRWWRSLTRRPGSTPSDAGSSTRQSPEPARRDPGREHRRHPRIPVKATLHGYGVELAHGVTIREVSRGGFSVESRTEFTVGQEHTFLFTAADGNETLVRCQCRHSHMTRSTDGVPVCVAGFEFLPQPEENLKVIVETIQKLQKENGKR